MKKLAFVLLLSLTVMLVACDAGAAKTQQRVELTGDHLKSMVLIKDDLGPAYADFNLDGASGPRTSEQLVNESDDQDGEALDVAKFGTLLAHEDTYISQQALATRSGVIFLTDAVVLYANKAGAAGDLADSLGDTKLGFSGTSKYGTLQAFKTFNPKVGDGAQGEVIRLLVPGANIGIEGSVNVTITAIQFSRDRLGGTVVMMRFDAKDVKAEATDLARQLDKRMQMVLRGAQPPGANPSSQAQ